MATKTDVLIDMLEPVVTGMEYDFWGLEFIAQGKHSVLRVFIDSEKGIDVDDCAAVSRQLSSVLDVEDPIASEYSLEVSSPGMDRPLFNLEQYQKFTGHQVQLRLRVPFDDRRKFTGLLKGVEDDEVIVEVDNAEYLLPIETIDKANIVPQFK